jgi:hypothetical protein
MLTGLLVLFIVSSSVLATDNNASSTIATDNNMAESSLSPHSTNETHNVNQSLMNMTMMTKMIESLFQYPMQFIHLYWLWTFEIPFLSLPLLILCDYLSQHTILFNYSLIPNRFGIYL